MNTLEQVDQAQVEEKTSLAVKKAQQLNIDSDAAYEGAAVVLKGLKALQKEVKATFDPVCTSAHDTWKKATAARATHSQPLEAAEGIIKRKMGAYHQEKEKARIAAENTERARLKKEAEEDRLEAAVNAEGAGDDAEAERLLAAPLIPAPVQANVAPPKVAGISQRVNWKFEIVDPDKIPREYMTPDTARIGGVVRAMKDQTNIDGIRVYADRSVTARG